MFSKYSKEQLQTAVAALKNYKEGPFVRHEWEELVSRLCNINDPQIREKMHNELKAILEKDPGFKVFMAS
ncbi:MAG: hypothetical protein WCK54_06430 [Desulfuromonadales bacterium]